MSAPLRERLYGVLLRLYPRDFRRAYRTDLVQAFRDRHGEPRHRGPIGRVRFWSLILSDLVVSAVRERVRAGRAPGLRGESTQRGWGDGMRSFVQDVGYALRTYRRSPGFLGIALLTLGLGIGATTTMYSVLDGVLLRPLPYEAPERLVLVGSMYGGRTRIGSVSPPDFFDWQERVTSFEWLAASRLTRKTLLGDGEPERLEAAGVSAEFFPLFGVSATVGRVFTPEEDEAAAAPVAVLRHEFWQGRFGGARDVLGSTLMLDGRPFTVVGVLPADFHPPEAIHQDDVQLWFPLAHVDDPLDDRRTAFIQVVGRLAPGVGLEAARAELKRLVASTYEALGRPGSVDADLAPLHVRTVGSIGDSLRVLFGAVALLLLIACANVAGLFLVRSTVRGREIAMRAALGAGRGRIARQLLTESVVLGLLGGLLGVALAFGGVRAFVALNPGDVPRLAELGVHGGVLAFALALSIGTGLLFGLSPALRGARRDIVETLRRGSGRATGDRGAGRLRNALVVGETALAIVLVVGAALLLNSFAHLVNVDPGYRLDDVARIEVELSDRYDTPERRTAFFTELVDRIEALPGVAMASGVNNLPLDQNTNVTSVRVEEGPAAGREDPLYISYVEVLPGYFETMGIRRVAGRTFGARVEEEAGRTVVVNETMARRFWPEGSAVGRRLRFGAGDGPWYRVIGVVADIKQYGLDREPSAQFHVPALATPRARMHIVAHTQTDPAATMAAMREAVRAMDPALPIGAVGTMRDQVERSVVEPRFYTLLLSSFAAVALLLAFVGLYGVLSFAVAQRTREMGIRMALGAAARDVRRAVVSRGMVLAALGIGLGLAGALAASRALAGFVFGITTTDAPTFAAGAALMAAVAFLGCWLPARRASAIDPVAALRAE